MLKLPDTRPLAGDLKKVEFTATTNGLNSQLSLDKLKTNSCSLSKKRGGQLFPSGQTVTGNHSLQQYNILNCLLDSVIFLNFVYHMELSETNSTEINMFEKQNKQTIPIDNIAVQQSQWSGTLTRSCFQFPSTSRNLQFYNWRWTTLYPIYNSTIGNDFYDGQHCIHRRLDFTLHCRCARRLVSSSGQLFRHLGSCGDQRTDANAPEEPFSQNIHRLSANIDRD